jgi:hypothetical protein
MAAKNFWIYPEQAEHNMFFDRVEADTSRLPEAVYHTASEIRFAGLSERQMVVLESVAHEFGWATQREGEDYRR